MERCKFGCALGTSLAAALLASGAHAADPELVAAAQEEGEVVWYTTMIVDQAVRPLVAAFEEAYPGIDVEFSRAGGAETALKVINEGTAGRMAGDVFDSISAYSSIRSADLVEPYTPASATGIPEQFKDPEGYWHAPNVYYLSAAINTDVVDPDEAPQTFEDLLDPEWQDQMVWSVVPQESGAPGFVGNVLMTMGEADGMEYLERLAAQGITNMDTSQRTVLDRVILGDFPIGLMTYTHHSPISAAEGAPVDWLRIEPLVASPNTVGLIRGGPNPNAGKLLVDFILSPEGQSILAEAMYLPTSLEVPALVPELEADGPTPFTATFMSPDVIEEGLADWIEIVDRLFM
jgi:ABC-type Fe3+ transport system substrate-binding protein